MPNVLIRDLTDADLHRLDARARALGLSRSEYIRRVVRNDAARRPLSRSDLERFAKVYADLGDPAVMSSAWQ